MEKKFVIVPLGGNSFITNKPQSAGDGITPNGWTGWNDEKKEYHIYFKIKADAVLSLSLLCRKTCKEAPNGRFRWQPAQKKFLWAPMKPPPAMWMWR